MEILQVVLVFYRGLCYIIYRLKLYWQVKRRGKEASNSGFWVVLPVFYVSMSSEIISKGGIMKKNILVRGRSCNTIIFVLSLLVCFWAFGSMTLAASFKDVPAGADYAEAVNTLADIGVLTGDENGNFNPNSTITRAEFATIICRLLGVDNEAKEIKQSSFTDVSASHWAVGYIAKANELGIINGNGDGTFSPESPVTQEQAVKMLVCAWGYEAEANEAGGWPNGYLSIAKDLGFTNDITINNSVAAKRSLVARIIYNALSVNKYIEG